MEARRGETKGLAAQHDSPARPQDGRRPALPTATATATATVHGIAKT